MNGSRIKEKDRSNAPVFLFYTISYLLFTASIITGSGTVLVPVPVQWSGLILL